MKVKTGFRLIILILLPFFFNACSPRINKAISTEYVKYPIAPSVTKVQFLKSFSGSAQVEKKQNAFQKTVVGEKAGQSILKPYGAFIRHGKIYVCDLSIRGLEIIDLEKNEFNYFIPEGVYSLKLPLNTYVDIDNKRYIVDGELHRISIFDENGKYITSFGLDENLKPTAISISENDIYIVDSENHRINVYNKETKEFKYYFPKVKQDQDAYLFKPTNIAVGNDKVYVSDLGGGDYKVFNLRGQFIHKVGKYGKNIGEFVRPKGIAADHEGNVYVVDASFENVQIFNNAGQLLMFFGGHYSGPGGMWLPTSVSIDYDNLKYFEKYVDPNYKLEYLIIVVNQFGPDKVNVYGRVNPK